MRSCELTAEHLDKFCNKIKYNKKLKILNLYGNNRLGLDGVKLVLEYVTNQNEHKKLESLNISNCGLKNDDTKHLTEFFEKKIITEDEKNILLQKEKDRDAQIKNLEKTKAKIRDVGPYPDQIESKEGEIILLKNTHITHLNLSMNELSDGKALLDFLRSTVDTLLINIMYNKFPVETKRAIRTTEFS